MIHRSKNIFQIIFSFFLNFVYRNNHPSPSPVKLNLPIQETLNVESEGEIEDDDDEHQLNIDDSKEQNTTIFENDEQSSDDEQVRKYFSMISFVRKRAHVSGEKSLEDFINYKINQNKRLRKFISDINKHSS